MMFDFILADRAIPDVMKAVIGRLQIPILKVAIIDQMFFAKKSHPARKLLNKLAEVAVGWNEENDQDRAVFYAMKNVVQRILNEFDNNIEIFEIVLNELETFVLERDRVARAQIHFTAKSAEKQERLVTAKLKATEAVHLRVKDEDIPQSIRDFVIHT